jgi:hypothetical protein
LGGLRKPVQMLISNIQLKQYLKKILIIMPQKRCLMNQERYRMYL